MIQNIELISKKEGFGDLRYRLRFRYEGETCIVVVSKQQKNLLLFVDYYPGDDSYEGLEKLLKEIVLSYPELRLRHLADPYRLIV